MYTGARFHTGTEKLSACSREVAYLDLPRNPVQIYVHFRERHEKAHASLPWHAQLLSFPLFYQFKIVYTPEH